MKTTIDVSNWPVMPTKCATCPFHVDDKGRHLDPCLVARIQSRLFTASQICHHPRIAGGTETHLCRGARDWQTMIFHRLGVLAAPTDEAWLARVRSSTHKAHK